MTTYFRKSYFFLCLWLVCISGPVLYADAQAVTASVGPGYATTAQTSTGYHGVAQSTTQTSTAYRSPAETLVQALSEHQSVVHTGAQASIDYQPAPLATGNDHAIHPPTTDYEASFAIIVDELTYAAAAEGLAAYRTALERFDHMNVYTVVGSWDRPDPIQRIIRETAEQDPRLEGFVLVGDIPIPMIRDAQHMTSSFKMDQDRFSLDRSSVPSDRFYDDFDLLFDYLGPDEDHPLKHYYSVRPESPQFLSMDLYSGRIKAPADGTAGRHMVNRYLLRIAEQKHDPPTLQHALFTTGHGYHSESLASWEGEITSLREQFPQFFVPGGSLTNFYHFKEPDLKQQVIRELQRPRLDMAIFHAHGTPDRQLLVGAGRQRTVQAQVDAIQLFLRNRVRAAKRRGQSIEDVKQQYFEQHQIDASWFDGAFDDEIIKADSSLSAEKDILIADIEDLFLTPHFVMFDQCFNGAFIHSPYIAGSYVFGPGNTVAALAHSVSVLQDTDANQFLGLLSEGMRVGWLPYFKNHLETHIIGDPTFRYSMLPGEQRDRFAPPVRNVNTLLREQQNIDATWRAMLDEDKPNFRALAVEMMARIHGVSFADDLVHIYKSDPAYIVRLQAFKSLARFHSDHIHRVLPMAVNDPYEYIRRASTGLMGDIGRHDYMEIIADALVNDHSRRVRFKARTAIQKVNAPDAANACRVVLAEQNESETDFGLLALTFNNFDRTAVQLEEEMIPAILDRDLPSNERRRTIRGFRLYRYQQVVEPLLELISRDDDEEELRILAVEALGWYVFSYQRNTIIEELSKTRDLADENGALRAEITRTINRLTHQPNHPFTL